MGAIKPDRHSLKAVQAVGLHFERGFGGHRVLIAFSCCFIWGGSCSAKSEAE